MASAINRLSLYRSMSRASVSSAHSFQCPYEIMFRALAAPGEPPAGTPHRAGFAAGSPGASSKQTSQAADVIAQFELSPEPFYVKLSYSSDRCFPAVEEEASRRAHNTRSESTVSVPSGRSNARRDLSSIDAIRNLRKRRETSGGTCLDLIQCRGRHDSRHSSFSCFAVRCWMPHDRFRSVNWMAGAAAHGSAIFLLRRMAKRWRPVRTAHGLRMANLAPIAQASKRAAGRSGICT